MAYYFYPYHSNFTTCNSMPESLFCNLFDNIIITTEQYTKNHGTWFLYYISVSPFRNVSIYNNTLWSGFFLPKSTKRS